MSPPAASPSENIALLIDADNSPSAKIEFIIAELAKYGVVNIRRAYGNWKSDKLKGWADILHEFAIQPMQQFDLVKGKNATDMAMLIDAMDILYTKGVSTFCLVSSDCDFTPLVQRLRADGKRVIGFGGQKTPEPFKKQKAVREQKASNPSQLKADAKSMNLLEMAVKASGDEEGWANLGLVGSHISNQGPFDPRNYGFAKLSDLYAAIDLFEMKEARYGQITSFWVRKRKTARLGARRLSCMAGLVIACAPVIAAELTPSEIALKEQLGPGTPDPIPLWPGRPPRMVADAPPETVDANAHIRFVSVPTITPYLPPPEKRTGRAIIVCAGDWKTHVVYAAQVFNPKGIAVIGLKYRLRPPNGSKNEDIQAIALLDARRAVRVVRQRAAEWGIDPQQIGVAGYSAGGNLAMNLAANFDAGDGSAPDPIERLSSRPDFAVGLATWHWRQKESPFHFTKDAPPVFLVHATNDGINGGAPIEMPRAIKMDLEKLGVPVRMVEFDEGGHGVGNLIPQRVKNGFAPAKWPELLWLWLDEIAPRSARREK